MGRASTTPSSADVCLERFRKKLPSIARRFISDVMKRPGPEGLRGPEATPAVADHEA